MRMRGRGENNHNAFPLCHERAGRKEPPHLIRRRVGGSGGGETPEEGAKRSSRNGGETLRSAGREAEVEPERAL
ncbi:hypothetical protein AAFF_G00218200 [Aldrovandia affinis]|uniref:Uncharacterized protein n=1 Tax=Aldrovandia affinis TaxID=143900 RepID=A0AAD7SXV1_9TELE|nr:hypothetical protein AAFF_G00218200 [Aldrovandia affinis]